MIDFTQNLAIYLKKELCYNDISNIENKQEISMKQLTVAVIGCGKIANSAHLPAISENSEVKIKYAIDVIEERAKKAAEKYGIPNFAADYKDALKDKEVDAVIICTPNYSHYTICMDSLRAGKHVFCEKPVTVNYALSLEMAKEADKQGKLLEIGVCNRYNRTVEIIKELYDTGALGDIYHVCCNFRSFRSIPGLGGDFTNRAIAGGGVLIDWGIHFLDLVLYILGLPKLKTVSAETYVKLGKDIKNYAYKDMWAGPAVENGIYDVEDFVTGFIRTEKASIAFNGAWAQNIGTEEMFIDFIGDKAGVRMDYFGNYRLYTAHDGRLEEVIADYKKESMYRMETQAFFRATATGTRTRNNVNNVLESMRLLDMIYQSAEQHKEILL